LNEAQMTSLKSIKEATSGKELVKKIKVK